MKQGAKKNWVVIILATVLVLSLAANGILTAKLINQPEDPSLSLYDPQYAIGRDEQTSASEDTTVPVPEQLISNRYITLVCPGDLNGRISVVTNEREDGVSMAFSGEFEGKTVELFEINLTKVEPEEYILGELQDENNGKFYVAMRVNDIQPEDWSEDVYNEICALQERVNDFIIQFHEDERFVPNR